MKPRSLLPLVALLVLSACVPRDRYDKSVKDAAAARADANHSAADRTRLEAETARLAGLLQAAQAAAEEREKAMSAGDVTAHDLQTKLDDATAQDEQLRAALERLGKNADTFLAEKGTLSTALADAKKRLEELRKAQAAADARLALFRSIALRFQKMIDAGQLKVALRDGRMVIQLANDVVFDSGQTVIKKEGEKAIGQVAGILKTIPGRRFQVAGDTDNVPIVRAGFPSNWELSAARAVEVVKFLVKQGVSPGLLSAAGYGEFDPIAPNDTPDGRAKNRRIEITLQPNVDELVAVPEAPGAAPAQNKTR